MNGFFGTRPLIPFRSRLIVRKLLELAHEMDATRDERTAALGEFKRRRPEGYSSCATAYSGRVRASPKCAKRLRSPNQVTADTRSSRSVSTIMA